MTERGTDEATGHPADLTDLTLAQAARLIQARELSPVDLVESYLSRIAEPEYAALNAYITVSAGSARAQAKQAAAEIEAGNWRGPLHGIPFAFKDIIDTAEIRTTRGSTIFEDRVPDTDAGVVSRIKQAGGIVLGKLNTHEFALGATNNNPHYGPARNPWNVDRISGGSSGGCGVAMAAHLAAATIGTDTGGSVRIPAALCGCVGFKPTFGRVTTTGAFPVSSLRDHVGPMTRTVEDAALVLSAVAGYDPDDPNSVNLPTEDFARSLDDGISGLRIGVPAGRFAERLTVDIRAAIECALDTFRELGATVAPVPLDLSSDEGLVVANGLFAVEARYYHSRLSAEQTKHYGADLKRRFAAPRADVDGVARALEVVDLVRVQFQRALEDFDVLVTPTIAMPALPIGVAEMTVDGIDYTERDLGFLARPMDYARLPSLSLPCGFTSDGLPIGLSITGRAFDEATVVRAAHGYEQHTEWHSKTPILAR